MTARAKLNRGGSRLGAIPCLWLSLLLLLLGCQPYLDHEPNRSEPASGTWHSGPKRPLELVGLHGDETSLLMVFNQPLRWPGAETAPAPFEPRLHPATPIAEVVFEGVAGVRVRFAEPLAMSSVYRVEVPTGWRAETGISLLHPIRRNWQTPRPELVSIAPQGVPVASNDGVLRLDEGQALELTFNQPINLGSLQSTLRLSNAESGQLVPVRLQPADPSERSKQAPTTRFTLRPDSAVVAPGRHRLEVAAGLRGWQGPLRGEPSRRFSVDLGVGRLVYQGEPTVASARRLSLKFSAAVAPKELLRCLVLLPDSAAPSVAVDGHDPSRLWLEFPGEVPRQLVLLSGLDGEGSRLARDVVITLASAVGEAGEPPARRSTGPPEPTVGFLASEQPFYAPGQTVLVAAAHWAQPESGDSSAPVLELIDEAGIVVDSRPLLPAGNGFFHAEMEAPGVAGRYRLRAAAATATRGWKEGELRVCPVASDGESYDLKLTEQQASFVVALQRQGPRRRQIGLRARFFPSTVDSVGPGLWRPAWYTLGQSRSSELEFPVGTSLGTGTVVMEAFDLAEPELTVARLERPVPMSAESAPAPAETPAAASASSPVVVIERRDRLVSPPLVGTALRLALADLGSGAVGEAVVLGGRVLSGWSAADRLSHAPPRSTRAAELYSYPLLSPLQASSAATFYDELHLEPGWQLALPPAEATGEQRFRLLARDKTGRLLETEARMAIGPASDWRPFTPCAVRPGDRFEAGAEFVSSAQEAAVLGLTGTALVTEETLAPAGYLGTAGVVKRGASRRLSFQYELPEAATSPTRLAWEFGAGGTLQRLEAELVPLQTPVVVRGGGRRARLETGAARRLPLSEALPWRLVLYPPERQGSSARLDISGSHGSLGRVDLGVGAEPVVLQGAATQALELVHLQGEAVSYELSVLEPDRGATAAWGGQLYLLRRLLDESGRPSETVALGGAPKVELSLVVPVELPPTELRLPLPGGVRPLQLSPASPGSPELLWSVRPGEVTIPLPPLSPGEYRWSLDVEPVAAGDYLWPTATVSGPQGEPLALSGSGRLSVKVN